MNQPLFVVRRKGFEPPTFWFAVIEGPFYSVKIFQNRGHIR